MAVDLVEVLAFISGLSGVKLWQLACGFAAVYKTPSPWLQLTTVASVVLQQFVAPVNCSSRIRCLVYVSLYLLYITF